MSAVRGIQSASHAAPDEVPEKDSIDDVLCSQRPLDVESRPRFDAAFRDHHTSLIRFVRRRVGSEADARDIAQDAYVRLMRYREHQDPGSLKALVFRIAANLVGMRARTARSQRFSDHQSLDGIVEVASNDPSVERVLTAQQQLDRLMQVIEDLPNKCRQAFVLSRFHDLSYPEIAMRLGVSVKMVEKHITHALARCRQEVGDEHP